MSVAAAMEEVAIGIAHISDNAEDAHRLASESHDRSVSGIQLAESASRQMAELQGTVQASSEKISALQTNSELIRNAAETIRSIADQTNLLALNAAIEAARAGEAGRGFAVVADEVRKLAERTSLSTGEIHSLVSEITGVTESVVAAMEQVGAHTAAGEQQLASTMDTLQHIVEASEQVNDMVRGIAETNHQQSITSHDLVNRTVNVSEQLEASAHAVQLARGMIDDLLKQAEQMTRLARHFEAGG